MNAVQIFHLDKLNRKSEEVDFLKGNEGDKVTFDQVLMVGGSTPKVGAPLVSGATVEATIKEQTRASKVIVFKYKRRKNYKRTRGHKQPLTIVEIGKING